MIPFDAVKLSGLMDAAGIDLLLASTRHNIRYLTGGYVYHFNERSQRAGSTQYQAFVGVPANRVADSFYIGAGGETLGLNVLPLWIANRDLAGGQVASSARVAAATARKMLGPGSHVGIEMSFLPAEAFASLQMSMPGATFVDATDLLHELRAVKTVAEIGILRSVSDRVSESIRTGFQSGQDGVSTRDVAETIERDMGSRGLSFLWAFTNAGPGYLRAPSPTKWETGRLLHLDCGGEEGDYLADICRMGSLGEPSAQGRALVEECLAIQNDVRAQLRAGLTFGEVNQIAQGIFAKSRHAGLGKIVAHGIGMVSHEQPMINVASQSRRNLLAGHVISVETEFLHPECGHVKIEDTLAITSTGADGLGDLGRELFVVRA